MELNRLILYNLPKLTKRPNCLIRTYGRTEPNCRKTLKKGLLIKNLLVYIIMCCGFELNVWGVLFTGFIRLQNINSHGLRNKHFSYNNIYIMLSHCIGRKQFWVWLLFHRYYTIKFCKAYYSSIIFYAVMLCNYSNTSYDKIPDEHIYPTLDPVCKSYECRRNKI